MKQVERFPISVLADFRNQLDNAEISASLSERFLGRIDTQTGHRDPKLRLSGANSQVYREIIIEQQGFEVIKTLASKRTTPYTNRLLLGAYVLLHSLLENRISNYTNPKDALVEIESALQNKLTAID